jgi:uncharacterized protein YcbX
MMGEVVRISRFAVKGLSEEILPQISLTTGRGFPGDREYALALATTVFDPENPQPQPKTRFAVLVRYAKLAELVSTYDSASALLRLHGSDCLIVEGNLSTSDGRKAIEEAITEHLADELKGPLRVVHAAGHRFTDVSVISAEMMEAVSLINVASVRDFEQKLEREVDPRRFRANLLIDGWEPWREFELIGRHILIGDVKFKVQMRTKRCAATEVNPDTAQRDIRVPLELYDKYKHPDMGVYLTVQSDGVVRNGDLISID